MTNRFEPFTPEAFAMDTGLNAADNEAIYIRWVNTQLNYASYHALLGMSASLNKMARQLSNNRLAQEENLPASIVKELLGKNMV